MNDLFKVGDSVEFKYYTGPFPVQEAYAPAKVLAVLEGDTYLIDILPHIGIQRGRMVVRSEVLKSK